MRWLLALVPAISGAQAAPDTAGWRVTGLPGITSAPETGFALAVLGYAVRDPGHGGRPTQLQLTAQVTQKRQWRVTAEWDRWTAGNAWRFEGSAEYRVYPLAFHGLGPDAPRAAEEIYEPRGWIVTASVQRRLAAGWYLQAGGRGVSLRNERLAPGGLLVGGTVPGSAGNRGVQWRGALVRDTRDDVLSPTRGAFVSLGGGVSVPGLGGGDFDYRRGLLDARGYLTTGRVTWAAQGYAEVVAGTAPFDDLPTLGNRLYLRGYPLGRWRDHALASAQLEARVPVRSRLSAAAFVAVGAIGPATSALGRPQPAIGGGLRWRVFSRSAARLRADVAIGREGKAIYLNLNEAF